MKRFLRILSWIGCVGVGLVVGPRAGALDPSKSIYQYNCLSWSRQNGLSVNLVTAIAQAKDGYLWLGTQNGLVRFDGSEFQNVAITLPQAQTQEVRRLIRARNGTGLYFGNKQGGFGMFDDRGFSPLGDERFSGLGTGGAAVLVEARSGALWFGMEQGWGRWTPGRPQETLYDDSEHFATLSMCEDLSGRVWRGTVEHGVSYFAEGKWVPIDDDELKKHNIFSLAADREGNLWVGTERELRCYDLASGKYKQSFLPEWDVRSLFVDSRGVVWAGGNGQGLARYKDGYFRILTKTEGLVSDYVTAIFEDVEGSLWVGTRDGLSQLSDVKFPIFSSREGFNFGPTQSVFLTQKQGLGVCGLGLTILEDGTTTRYSKELGNINNYLICGWQAKSGELYIIDGDKDILVMVDGKVVRKLTNTTWPKSFAEDKDGILVSVGPGLYRLRDGKLESYSLVDGKAPELYWINTLHTGRDGAIWAASSNGVCRFKDGHCQQWNEANGLSGPRAQYITEDDDGTIWVGLLSGIARIKNNRVVNINHVHGLFDDRIYGMATDNHGYMWMCSGRGIFRVSHADLEAFADGKINRIECEVFDGLESVKFADRTDQEPSACKTSDGRIWFPNPQGVVMIDPANFTTNKVPPSVKIQSIQSGGQPILDKKNAAFAPGTRRLEFSFSALSFVAPKKIQVRYQLEGFDPVWIDAGLRRSAVYDNLPPGKYRFRVRAANADGVWNETGDEYIFELPPAFYETLWFKAVCFLAGVGLIFGVFRWKVRRMELEKQRLEAENDLLEQKVAKRTAELEREHALLRALLDNSPDYIYFKDRQSRFLKISLALAKDLGAKNPDEAVGKSDFDYFTAEHARPAYEDEQEIMRTGRPIIGKIEEEAWSDGHVSWAITSKMPLRSSTGEIVGTFGLSKDITEIKKAEAELAEVHKQLLETSRQSGMAEVATNVLHNVGNVLNSVNVSSTVVKDRLRQSKLVNLSKVSDLLRENEGTLATFLTQDPRGLRLPGYIHSLSEHLVSEQRAMLEEIELLCKKIEHIKDIVAMQQSYAKVSGITETLGAVELVEDALNMNQASFVRHDVIVERNYQARPSITVDKHKVLQILVNLLKNAKVACDDTGKTDKRIKVTVSAAGERVRIEVADNGVGIPPENLTKIFSHGFTTRKEGHGFGLHSGALAAKKLGGSLIAHSDGEGQGATFALELPCKPAERAKDGTRSSLAAS